MATVLIAVIAFAVGLVAGRFLGGFRAAAAQPIERPAVPIAVRPVIEASEPEIAAPPVAEAPAETASPPKRKPRETTVLVCDVRSGSPEDDVPANVLRCLSDLQRILAGIIGDEGGSIDRFAGDRIIAVFIAKGRRTDHAGHALEAAQRIANNVDAVSRRLAYDLRIAIGVHSGSQAVGGDGHVDQTAIGDVIDVASRLEALAGEAKVPLIVSEDVLERAEDERRAFEAIGEVVLSRGDTPRRVFALKSGDGAVQLDLIDLGSAMSSRAEIAQ